MPRIYSKRHSRSNPTPPADAVYVGRPTPFGNPFIHGVNGTRKQVIEKYRQWIYEPDQSALRYRMRRELRGKDLVCWCAPLPCHADVIMEIANA